MTTMHPYRVYNWFCAKCSRWLATEDLRGDRHEECDSEVQWLPYRPQMDYHAMFRGDIVQRLDNKLEST